MVDISHPDWLKRAMEDADVRTGELAERSGISRSQIQRIVKGGKPRLDTLLSLQRALTRPAPADAAASQARAA